MVEKIKAIVIFEMLGRPADYLKETLKKFIDKVNNEKGVKILGKKIKKPKKLEQAKQELYTTFAEAELEFEDMQAMFKIIFIYMPSHIDIISPEEIKIKNFDLNVLMTELARRLHQYDEITKRLSAERNILYTRLKQTKEGGEIIGEKKDKKNEEKAGKKTKKKRKKKDKKK